MKKKLFYALIPFLCGIYIIKSRLANGFDGSVMVGVLYLVVPIIYLVMELFEYEKNYSIQDINNPISHDTETVSSTPPYKSLITIEQKDDETIELHYPKKGFDMFDDLPHLVFCIVIIPFIVFFTGLAIQSDKFVIFIAIPFWLVGMGLWKGFLRSIFETQTIYLTKKHISLEKKSFLYSKKLEYPLSETVYVKMKHLKALPFGFSHPYGMLSPMMSMNWKRRLYTGVGIDILAIFSSKSIEYFFERANDIEKQWVVKYIDFYIKNFRNSLDT